MKSVILSFSGGLDSTVLLWYLVKQLKVEVRALSVNYGQRHNKELVAASELARIIGVEHKVIDLSVLRSIMGGSSQTSDLAVPLGHYEEESMRQTVVPNRNMILLALAGAWAVSVKADGIAYAAHGGDHAIYPDCRPEFTQAMQAAFQLCDWHKVELYRPFLGVRDISPSMTKADIVRMGERLGVPFEKTWSCYQGNSVHCGRCGTDVERREAFQVAGVTDPTTYEV